MNLYDKTLYAIGALGGTVSAFLMAFHYDPALSLSVGLNVSMLLSGYVWFEGWHVSDTPPEVKA